MSYTDKLKSINLLDLMSTYREEKIKESLGEVSSLHQAKLSINKTMDAFIKDFEVSELVANIDSVYTTYENICSNILKQEQINIEDSKAAIEAIYSSVYKLENLKGLFQDFYSTISTAVSVLKIIRNSYTSTLLSLDNKYYDDFSGSPVKTKSGKDDILNSLFFNLEGYQLLLDDSCKKKLLSCMYRLDGINAILLKQENSIKVLYRDIAHLAHTEARLSQNNL